MLRDVAAAAAARQLRAQQGTANKKSKANQAAATSPAPVATLAELQAQEKETKAQLTNAATEFQRDRLTNVLARLKDRITQLQKPQASPANNVAAQLASTLAARRATMEGSDDDAWNAPENAPDSPSLAGTQTTTGPPNETPEQTPEQTLHDAQRALRKTQSGSVLLRGASSLQQPSHEASQEQLERTFIGVATTRRTFKGSITLGRLT